MQVNINLKPKSDDRLKKSKNWCLVDNGEKYINVYDIETKNHTFIGNGILVHNSFYLDIPKVLEYLNKKKNLSREEKRKYIERFCDILSDSVLKNLFTDMRNELNLVDEPIMGMDRESIALPYDNTGKCGLWLAKKHYALLLDQMEEIVYTHPHMKLMGLASVQSTMPELLKKPYNQILNDIITEGHKKARETYNKFKEEFFNLPYGIIGIPTSVTAVDKFTDPKTGLPYEGQWYDPDMQKNRNGGVPINARAAISYNYLLRKFKLDKKYDIIKNNANIRYVFLSDNQYGFSVIALNDDNTLPKEFKLDKFVDYNQHFERMFRKPISDIFEACGLSLDQEVNLMDFI